MSAQQINNYINGKSHPRRSQVKKIAQALKVSPVLVAEKAGYLEQQKASSSDESILLDYYRSLPPQIQKIFFISIEAVSQSFSGNSEPHGRMKLFGSVGAGQAVEMNIDEDIDVPTRLLGRNRFALRVTGDSMNTIADDGDYVVIESCDQPKEGVPCVFQIESDGAVLKKWKRKGQKIALISTNPEYANRIEPGWKVKCQGWLVEVVKKS